MADNLNHFEAIVRATEGISARASEISPAETSAPHSFEARNIHPALPPKVRKLFDDDHFAESTFHAFKYLDKQVQRHSSLSESGFKLMMSAFDEGNPKLALRHLGQKVRGMNKGDTYSFSRAEYRQFAIRAVTSTPLLTIRTSVWTI